MQSRRTVSLSWERVTRRCPHWSRRSGNCSVGKRVDHEETMHIIAIGGGSLKKKQTLPIDRYIVKLAGKKSPRALFIPTASGDPQDYCEAFDHIYGELLGCRTDSLLLYRRREDRVAAAGKIRSADLIYVGGGNT